MNIFVAKLDYDTQEADLRNAFEAYGEVDSVKIIIDKFTNRSKGFGFVEMNNNEEALAAIEGLNESELDGRRIVVKKSQPKSSPRQNRGGYNRNYGNNDY